MLAGLERWAELNDFDATPSSTDLPDVVDDGTTVTRDVYDNCGGGVDVALYAVIGGGHAWPGSGSLGSATQDISASEIILDTFFEQS